MAERAATRIGRGDPGHGQRCDGRGEREQPGATSNRSESLVVHGNEPARGESRPAYPQDAAFGANPQGPGGLSAVKPSQRRRNLQEGLRVPLKGDNGGVAGSVEERTTDD